MLRAMPCPRRLGCVSTQHLQPSVTDGQELVQLQRLLNSLVTICEPYSLPKFTTALRKVVTALLIAEDFGGLSFPTLRISLII